MSTRRLLHTVTYFEVPTVGNAHARTHTLSHRHRHTLSHAQTEGRHTYSRAHARRHIQVHT